MKKIDNTHRRAEVLEGAPLHYAPQNELGVVFLFSHVLKKLRLKLDEIRPQFPDCIAYQKVGGVEKKVRIEFEFKSRNFRTQGHDHKKCDWVVCWEDNWPDVPEKLYVLELRKMFGLGFNVWIQPVSGKYSERLSEINFSESWSVPSLSNKGDLLLYYHTSPDKCIKDIFKLAGSVEKGEAGWREGKDYFSSIRRICRLKSPVFFEDLKQHKILRTAFFVRSGMQGRPRATEYWPYLFEMIIQRNPNMKRSLMKYAPDRL